MIADNGSPRGDVPPEKPPIHPELHHIDANVHGDFYEECGEELQPLGTCVSMYGFEGSGDGTTIAMKEGDEMLLLERDEGDGWTRVRHIATNLEGFVPTSYLQCKWYPQ